MNKNVIIGLIALVVVGGGSAYALTQSSPEKEAVTTSQAAPSESEAMAMKKAEDVAMEKEMTSGEDEAMAAHGSFSDYDSAKLASAEKGDVVLFFSASWCPTCQRANKNFNASTAPDGLTVLKLDYDNSTDLKKKYGVTYQHTFVQVDKDGNQLKKWHGSDTYDELTAQII